MCDAHSTAPPNFLVAPGSSSFCVGPNPDSCLLLGVTCGTTSFPGDHLDITARQSRPHPAASKHLAAPGETTADGGCRNAVMKQMVHRSAQATHDQKAAVSGAYTVSCLSHLPCCVHDCGMSIGAGARPSLPAHRDEHTPPQGTLCGHRCAWHSREGVLPGVLLDWRMTYELVDGC